MDLAVDFVNYPQLLAGNDQQAFLSAMSAHLFTNFQTLLSGINGTLGLPTQPLVAEPTMTQVAIVSADPSQPQPEAVQYTRLDLGKYLACCQLYVSQALLPSVPTPATLQAAFATWLQSVHGLWFDSTKLTVVQGVASGADYIPYTVSVDPTNYVWVGSVTLRIVPANHLALLAVPGSSKGLQPQDVGASSSTM